MLNFKFFWENELLYISELNNKHKQEIPAKYINYFIYVFYVCERSKRIGNLFKVLVDHNQMIHISEYDLLNMIKILLVKEYNLASGKWLKEYYELLGENAQYELKKILFDK